MKYQVIFHSQAEQDIRISFDWGVRNWGKVEAEQWLRQIYRVCKKRLTQFPDSCPIAPESEEIGVIIRQLVIDRYRVLFTIQEKTVIILYVRGAYIGSTFDEFEE